MSFTLIGVAAGIVNTVSGANPLFALAYLIIGYGIDRNRKARQWTR